MHNLIQNVRHFYTGSIRRQLIIGIVFVHATLMTIFVFDMVQRQTAFLSEQLVKHASSLALSLSANSVPWVLSNDVIGLEEIIGSQSGYQNLKYAMVINTQGRVLGYSDPAMVGQYVNDAISLSLLDSPAETTVLINDSNIIDVAVPIETNATIIGWARVGLGLGVITDNIKVISRDGIIYTVLAIIIGTVFAIFMAKGLTSAIRHLLDRAERVRLGDLTARTELDRIDELGTLGSDFNTMLDSMVESRDELERNRERISIFANIASDLLWETNAHHRITYASENIDRVLKQEAEWVLGQRLTDIVGRPFLLTEVNDASEIAAMADFKPFRDVDTSIKLSNGETRYLAVSGQPIFDEDRNFHGYRGTLRDISKRITAETQVRALNEELEIRVAQRTRELEAINKEMESFTYSVSHDLRAPLRAIDGFTKIVINEAGDTLGDENVQHLQKVRNASQRMGNLINDFLKLSREGRGKITINPVNISKLSTEISAQLKEQAPDRKITWAIQADIVAQTDPGFIRIVLENILGNAWKYSAKVDHATIEFGSVMLPDTRQTAYFVRDNGAGFSTSDIDNLFKPFTRMHTTEDFEGTGIGLSIVQRIIHRLGGEIWATSSPEKGTSFFFTLPEA